MNDELRQLVWDRAAATCEYCRVQQQFDPLPFGVDHIRPQYHHGPSVEENLCLACFQCNTFKAVNVAGYDPTTGQLVALFQPRRDLWDDHFNTERGWIIGKTPTGRVTVDVLRINLPERVEHRRLLAALGVWGA
jgi:5-methylcytosine-specific restriction endonuclease McrA